jgi:hypothetical protein
MTKERIKRNIKMYFEPLVWAFSPKKHFNEFLFIWALTLLLFVLSQFYGKEMMAFSNKMDAYLSELVGFEIPTYKTKDKQID